MATLGIGSYDAEDDEVGAAAAALNSNLTWQWSTWPTNLRRSLIVVISLIALLSALIAAIFWLDGQLSKKLQIQDASKTQAQARLQNSGRERSDIENNLPLLRQLESSGIFGEEKRIEWIEQIRITEKRWPGVAIRFDISAQAIQSNLPASPATPATPIANAPPAMMTMTATSSENESPTNSKGFGIFHTKMKLSMKLLHEGDALAIIEELKTAKLGRIEVNECSFKRTIVSQASQPAGPLDAECLLTWVSMKTYKP